MLEDRIDRRRLIHAAALASASLPFGGCRAQSLTTSRSISAFLPAGYDAARDDCSDALERAAEWSAAHGEAVLITGKLLLRNVAIIETAGASFFFDRAEFGVRDDGGMGSPSYRGFDTVPMGILVRAEHVSLLGSARFIGLGVPGRTRLFGMWFDAAHSARVGNFYFEKMAFGQMFMCCDAIEVGDTQSYLMYGTQDHGKAGAGSAQVIAGCQNSRFGKLRALENEKPMRYLSAGMTSARQPRDNRSNQFGLVEGTGRPGSPWAQALGIRSSVDSIFEGANVQNVTAVLLIEKYDNDDRWSVRGNRFRLIQGKVIDTPSSLDGGVVIDNFSKTPIGANHIDTLRIEGPIQNGDGAPPQTYGVYATDGDLTIGTADIRGFTFQIAAYDCRLVIDSFISSQAGYEVFRYGRNLTGRISKLTIRTGIAGAVSNAGLIRAVDLGKPAIAPDFDILEISYAQNGSRNYADFVQYDPLFREQNMRLHRITGAGKQGRRWIRGKKI